VTEKTLRLKHWMHIPGARRRLFDEGHLSIAVGLFDRILDDLLEPAFGPNHQVGYPPYKSELEPTGSPAAHLLVTLHFTAQALTASRISPSGPVGNSSRTASLILFRTYSSSDMQYFGAEPVPPRNGAQ